MINDRFLDIEKIKKEAASVKGLEDLKFWDYNEVLKVFENRSNAFESINALGLVPKWSDLVSH